ncbi:hypothetical protein F383_13676 [Gossypium arboreum]|uniref:Uncharacterized protein n=1 Tax=Gossypium arboreum TaxID=29729 RepID=A0A0B0P9L7_GOSAR|nr:hypothetical protein F383_07804 [Gossypium arboreum]KHG30274.1 hypothetical protein F383_36386 [Gossypium arboreum]KHG30471.1 hypothetical protein F383_13676 [Gossypium arboreum]
MYRNLATFGII